MPIGALLESVRCVQQNGFREVRSDQLHAHRQPVDQPARHGNPRQAGVLADVGVRAYYDGFAAWIASTEDVPLTDVVRRELAAYRSVLRTVTQTPG